MPDSIEEERAPPRFELVAVKIFLDLDGPVLDNRAKYHNLYRRLVEEAGYSALQLREYWEAKRERVPEAEIVTRTCDPSFVAAYLKRRQAVIEDSAFLTLDVVWSGVPQLLKEWRYHAEIVLVTLRNRRRELLGQLSRLDLLECFDQVLSEDANAGNADVKVALITPHLGSSPGIVIGDTEADIEAGQRLGLRTVGVLSGIRSRRRLETLQPDRIVQRLTELRLRDLQELVAVRGAGARS